MRGFGFIYSILIIGIVSMIISFATDYLRNSLDKNILQIELDGSENKLMSSNLKSLLNKQGYYNIVTSESSINHINALVIYDARNISDLHKIFLVNLNKKLRYDLYPLACNGGDQCFVQNKELFQNSDNKISLYGNSQDINCLDRFQYREDREKICWFDTIDEKSIEPLLQDKFNSLLKTSNQLNKIFIISNAEDILFYLNTLQLTNYKVYRVISAEQCPHIEFTGQDRVLNICVDRININDEVLYSSIELDEQKRILLR